MKKSSSQKTFSQSNEIEYWIQIVNTKSNPSYDFILCRHDPTILQSLNFDHNLTIESAKILLENISTTDIDSLVFEIDMNSFVLTSSNVPQFSDLYNGSFGMCQFLLSNPKCGYEETGAHFTNQFNKIGAKKKYGEEHLKLGSQLGIVRLYRQNSIIIGELTPFGNELSKLNLTDFNNILPKLILRIPIIAELIKEAAHSAVDLYSVIRQSGISEKTVIRRASSIKRLIKELEGTDSGLLNERLSKIYW